mgnify:CR=1 FL=1
MKSDETTASSVYSIIPLNSFSDALFISLQISSIVVGVKLVAWYDNEWGYSNKLVDLACYIATK